MVPDSLYLVQPPYITQPLHLSDGRHDAPLQGSWLLPRGVTTPAGIVNKVTGGVVHRPGMTLVDGF